MLESIAIGSDHRGFPLKEALKPLLESMVARVEDRGTCSSESVDYPVFARLVAGAVSRGEVQRGLLICGSGIGMSVAANKFPGVRAALCHDLHSARMSREHNNANILVLAESVTAELAAEMVRVWIETDFQGGRHQRRLDLIAQIEQENFTAGC